MTAGIPISFIQNYETIGVIPIRLYGIMTKLLYKITPLLYKSLFIKMKKYEKSYMDNLFKQYMEH